MIKNIMGAAVAVALAVGIGTTGVRSNTTYKKPTQIIAAAKTTTLTDYHSNTEFTKSSDVKKIISTYGLKDSDKTSKIVYIPVNNYSVNDADGQNNEVSVDTRLASYSVKKEGYKDIKLIDTTNGMFVGHREAKFLSLAGSMLFIGRK